MAAKSDETRGREGHDKNLLGYFGRTIGDNLPTLFLQ